MVFKKIVAMLIGGIVLCTSLGVSAFADTAYSLTGSGIAPIYEIANNPQCILKLSGTTAYCTSETGSAGAISITVEQTLQKQGFLWLWYDVDDASWTATVNRNVISVENIKSGLSSGKYRLKTVFTLTDSSGETETITVYSDEKTVG